MSKAGTKESFLPPLWILTLLGVTVSLWLLVQLKEIVVLLVIGYSIAYIAHPLLRFMERREISRSVGLFVIFGLFLIFLGVITVTAVPTVARQYQTLSDNFPQYLDLARGKVTPLIEEAKSFLLKGADEAAPGVTPGPADLLSNISGDTVETLISGIMTALLGGYSLTLFLANLVLLPFIVYYLAIDFENIHTILLHLFPKEQRKKIAKIATEIDVYVAAFVRGQLLICTGLFVLYAIGLGIVGVDLWFLLAAIAGFGNVIPYFGFLCGIILSSIMALVTFGDFSHVMQVWLVFAIVQFLEGFIITPRVMGSKVGFSPLTVILAIFIGGKLLGLLGVFLAIPAAAVVKVLGRQLHGWILAKSAVA
ncbi:MAG: AI-2E family transporter [Deltaproteobacteria bacterium]|nr:AI-2E family transporter [Deltaproteobacteria bacterium]